MTLLKKIKRKIFENTFQTGIRYAFLTFLFCVVISICICLGHLYSFINDQYLSSNYNIVEQAGHSIDALLARVSLSENQAVDKIVNSALFDTDNINSAEVQLASWELEKDLADVRRSNPDICDFFVVTHWGRQMSSLRSYDQELFQLQNVYHLLDLSEKNHTITGTHDAEYLGYSPSGTKAVSFVRAVWGIKNHQRIDAYLQTDINYQSIEETLQGIQIDPSQKLYILDDQERLIYHQDAKKAGKPIEQFDNEAIAHLKLSTGAYPLKNLVVIHYTIPSADWDLIAIMDYGSVFLSLLKTLFPSAAIVLITIFFLLLLAFYFPKRIASPINELVQDMDHVNGEKLTALKITTSNRDMLILVNSYNQMLTRIENLNQQNLLKAKEKAEAEYRAYIAQTNPHFLFNTLENIRGLALRRDQEDLAETIHILSSLFQYSIETKRNRITLNDELSNLKNYIQIQKLRFGDKIDVLYSINPSTLDCTVIKFILQPIAENTIEHGYRRGKESLVLSVQSKVENDCLLIQFRDNGIGIPPERLKQIQLFLTTGNIPGDFQTRHHSGIGLMNVQSRIQFVFGKAYGVTITSEEGKGTNCTLRLPLIK